MAGLVPKKMRSTAAVAWCFMKHRLFACSSTSSICRTLMTLPWLSHLIWAWSARRTTPSCSCRSLGTVRSSHPDGLSPGSHNWKINLQFVVTPCAHRTKTSSSSWPSNLVVLHSEGYFGGFPKNQEKRLCSRDKVSKSGPPNLKLGWLTPNQQILKNFSFPRLSTQKRLRSGNVVQNVDLWYQKYPDRLAIL